MSERSGRSHRGMAGLAQQLDEFAAACIAERGAFHAALSGGETPLPLYGQLSARGWTVFLADERMVEDASLRNEPSIRSCLPEGVRLHPMWGHTADSYATLLPERLDLVVLGVGTDGHTASLFPGDPALRCEDAVALADGPTVAPPRPRLTLTLASIARARSVLVLVLGVNKRAIMARLRAGADVPAAHLPTHARWHVDTTG